VHSPNHRIDPCLYRVRSIYERALEIDIKNQSVWFKYIEFEMRHKNVNSARNLFDRVVTSLPRINQFWYRFIHMEDMLGNYAGVRQIYERWMQWLPDDNAWIAYIKFEQRNGETTRVRDIYRRWVIAHTTVVPFLRWAKFEETIGDNESARKVYEAAMETLQEDAYDQELFIQFANFEERCKEYERARVIYKFALDHLPKQMAREVYKVFIQFEKKYGSKEGIEDVIVNKRRFQYEEEIKLNPQNYDIWFDYVRLEEGYGNIERTRDVYERAVAQVPPVRVEKRFWKRYIYLWVNYAIFEELDAADPMRAREVYKTCLATIPHKQFSFSKVWIMYAHFEVRQKQLDAARKVLGMAIGMAPSHKIFRAYILLEWKLLNVDRCRTLFDKWLEFAPEYVDAWREFVNMETELGEYERVRAIFELAIEQSMLDMPEHLWKAYIDFEIAREEYDRVRELYERLLQRTQHHKVWSSYAQFELSLGRPAEARSVFSRAYDILRREDKKEERVHLVDAWQTFERENGDANSIKEVQSKLPRKVTKRVKLVSETGDEIGTDDVTEFIFPDEESAKPNLKLLEAARKWKAEQLAKKAAAAAARAGGQ
jgi:crooked neck